MNKIFIIGTDTNIGKTYITCNIAKYLVSQNKLVRCLKPVATGVNLLQDDNDSNLLLKSSNVKSTLYEVNPIFFQEPVAPHIASSLHDFNLDLASINKICLPIINKIDYDYILIEGVGGVLVPLNDRDTFIDLVKMWNFPVIIVVGIKLGCLNHCLLTINTLLEYKINIIGWVANILDNDMLYKEENIKYLEKKIKCPLIAINNFNSLADYSKIL